MNAFDAAKAGTGDTGLASLFAAETKAANGQGTENAPQGATPFAKLLDQLNALPVPQASGAQIPRSLAAAEGETPAGAGMPAPLTLSAVPGQQFHRAAGGPAAMAAQAERAPARLPASEAGLRLMAIGKMLPPAAAGGTILPAEPVEEVVPGEGAGLIAELPVTGTPAGAVSEDLARFMAPMAAPPITAPPPPAQLAASAASIRSIGAARAGQRFADDPASSAAAAPSVASVPAGPAVTLTAADAPATGDLPAAPERVSRDMPFAAAPGRAAAPVATDLHAPTSVAEPMATAPQIRPEPQQLAMQDLTQIVERLTAAREAAAPAATQLAVEHAEFGPLSLSIQQGERGELAIAVAAADQDSQVALAAAIAQGEAPGFEQAPERRGGESAQRDAAAAGQQSEQRGQGAQRERFAGQQQHRQMVPQREPARERAGETRSGTYA